MYKSVSKNIGLCVNVVVGGLTERISCEYDLVESLPRIQTLMQYTPVFHTSFHIRITTIVSVIGTMTSVCCASADRSSTLTPSCQYVCRHPTSTLISSKSAWTLASDERLTTVCVSCLFRQLSSAR